MRPRYYGDDEARKLGIKPGWYPVDENGNRLTDEPLGSEEDVEEWIRNNFPSPGM